MLQLFDQLAHKGRALAGGANACGRTVTDQQERQARAFAAYAIAWPRGLGQLSGTPARPGAFGHQEWEQGGFNHRIYRDGAHFHVSATCFAYHCQYGGRV